jgi:hypothetical protein
VLQTRREKISKRLRALQQLVPNGTKVDMVIMLERAISFAKFMQLQVKVRASLNVYTEFCCIGLWNSDMIEPQVLVTDGAGNLPGKGGTPCHLVVVTPSERGRLN